MNTPLVVDHHGSGLSGQVQRRLCDELAVLRVQREQLRGDTVGENRAADTGDRAEALRRADDVFRIDDRISHLNRLLATGAAVPATAAPDTAFAEGSTVTLRFPDGARDTFYVSSLLDTAPIDADSAIELLGPDSPLATALTGHTLGDTISWATPPAATRPTS